MARVPIVVVDATFDSTDPKLATNGFSLSGGAAVLPSGDAGNITLRYINGSITERVGYWLNQEQIIDFANLSSVVTSGRVITMIAPGFTSGDGFTATLSGTAGAGFSVARVVARNGTTYNTLTTDNSATGLTLSESYRFTQRVTFTDETYPGARWFYELRNTTTDTVVLTDSGTVCATSNAAKAVHYPGFPQLSISAGTGAISITRYRCNDPIGIDDCTQLTVPAGRRMHRSKLGYPNQGNAGQGNFSNRQPGSNVSTSNILYGYIYADLNVPLKNFIVGFDPRFAKPDRAAYNTIKYKAVAYLNGSSSPTTLYSYDGTDSITSSQPCMLGTETDVSQGRVHIYYSAEVTSGQGIPICIGEGRDPVAGYDWFGGYDGIDATGFFATNHKGSGYYGQLGQARMHLPCFVGGDWRIGSNDRKPAIYWDGNSIAEGASANYDGYPRALQDRFPLATTTDGGTSWWAQNNNGVDEVVLGLPANEFWSLQQESVHPEIAFSTRKELVASSDIVVIDHFANDVWPADHMKAAILAYCRWAKSLGVQRTIYCLPPVDVYRVADENWPENGTNRADMIAWALAQAADSGSPLDATIDPFSTTIAGHSASDGWVDLAYVDSIGLHPTVAGNDLIKAAITAAADAGAFDITDAGDTAMAYWLQGGDAGTAAKVWKMTELGGNRVDSVAGTTPLVPSAAIAYKAGYFGETAMYFTTGNTAEATSTYSLPTTAWTVRFVVTFETVPTSNSIIFRGDNSASDSVTVTATTQGWWLINLRNGTTGGYPYMALYAPSNGTTDVVANGTYEVFIRVDPSLGSNQLKVTVNGYTAQATFTTGTNGYLENGAHWYGGALDTLQFKTGGDTQIVVAEAAVWTSHLSDSALTYLRNGGTLRRFTLADIDSLVIDQGSTATVTGDATLQLTTTIVGTPDSETWSVTSGTGSVNSSTGLFTAPGAGVYTKTTVVRATALDGVTYDEITISTPAAGAGGGGDDMTLSAATATTALTSAAYTKIGDDGDSLDVSCVGGTIYLRTVATGGAAPTATLVGIPLGFRESSPRSYTLSGVDLYARSEGSPAMAVVQK